MRPEKQQDLFSARQRRDDGMARATDHADRVTPAWSVLAYEFLAEFCRTAPNAGLFLTEDVVTASESQVPEPPDRRAWGSIMATARRRGLIERTGVSTDKFMSPKPIWSSKIQGEPRGS